MMAKWQIDRDKSAGLIHEITILNLIFAGVNMAYYLFWKWKRYVFDKRYIL